MLVQAGIDANVGRFHFLFGEFADLFDGTWCALFETDVMNSLRQVNGAFTCDDLIDGRFVSLLHLWFSHF